MKSKTSTILELEETIFGLTKNIESANLKKKEIEESIKLLEAQKSDFSSTFETEKKARECELVDINKQLKSVKKDLGKLQEKMIEKNKELTDINETIAEQESILSEREVSIKDKEIELRNNFSEFSQKVSDFHAKDVKLGELEKTHETIKTHYENILKSVESKDSDLNTKIADFNERVLNFNLELNALENDKKVTEAKLQQSNRIVEDGVIYQNNVQQEIDAKLQVQTALTTETEGIKKEIEKELAIAKEERIKSEATRKANDDMANLLNEREIDFNQRENAIRLKEKQLNLGGENV